MHWNEPGELLQVESDFPEHVVVSKHSSISLHQTPLPVYPELHVHKYPPKII